MEESKNQKMTISKIWNLISENKNKNDMERDEKNIKNLERENRLIELDNKAWLAHILRAVLDVAGFGIIYYIDVKSNRTLSPWKTFFMGIFLTDYLLYFFFEYKSFHDKVWSRQLATIIRCTGTLCFFYDRFSHRPITRGETLLFLAL